MNPLQVTDLTKVFTKRSLFKKTEQFTAVDHISFHMQDHEILGFLGPNGAGKTTTIQMLLGTLIPTSGSIQYFGKELAQNRSETLTQVTYASGYDKLPSRLTVYENLDIYARLYNVPSNKRVERITHFLKFFGMWEKRDTLTAGLSAGQMTRILLAKAFIPYPHLVLLDEPTASLDPEIAYDVRQFILEQNKRYGTAVLFTSHNMEEVTELCSRVLVLKSGSIIADSSPLDLAASVATAHVHLMITNGLEQLITYTKEHAIPHKREENSIKLQIAEKHIAVTLNDLAKIGVLYSQISIDKPSLEDYFISVAKH